MSLKLNRMYSSDGTYIALHDLESVENTAFKYISYSKDVSSVTWNVHVRNWQHEQ